MFIYMAVENGRYTNTELMFKIGFCYGNEKNKRRTVRYNEGYDIVKTYQIQARDTAGGEWIEHTTQEFIKAASFGYRYKHIPNDRFQARSVADILDLYQSFEQYVSKAQTLYLETFGYYGG